jgi:signal transduction histidine kinase
MPSPQPPASAAIPGLTPGARQCDCVTICVRDDGPGITPDERQHIFDPFYSARQAGRGLGLGLSKCWRIVTNHGGRIEVASQPGHGAAFTVTLPATGLAAELNNKK